MSVPTPLLALEAITHRIFVLREQKVLLDSDLAALYGVGTRRLNEQVRRNRERFPKDFIFALTREEFTDLKSQFATSTSTERDTAAGASCRWLSPSMAPSWPPRCSAARGLWRCQCMWCAPSYNYANSH